MEISIVIPAYNEERRLPGTLEHWVSFFETQTLRWEVIVVDDGSRDGTAAIVESMAVRNPNVRLIRLAENGGKGRAVRAGMLQATGAHVFYVDADLNIAPSYVLPFTQALQSGYDVAIGTRDAREYAATERSLSRVGAGLLIQGLRRALLLPTIRDTQCGFKGFKREVVREVFSRATITSFAFDIEILFICRKLGLRIREIPVSVQYREGSTYSLRRHLKPFLADIIKVKRQDMQGAYASRGKPE